MIICLVFWGFGRLVPGPGAFGAARDVDVLYEYQRCVCFSEIPLPLLERLVDRRSRYGVGFRQDSLVTKGGARVWYLDKDGSPAVAFRVLVASKRLEGVDPDDPLWRLTPLVDFPGDYGSTQYRFEWEREWRVPHEVVFEPRDVAFIFLPEGEHSAARAFFQQAEQDETGPNYTCPFIDPLWPMERIQEAATNLPSLQGESASPRSNSDPDECPFRQVFEGGLCPACGHEHGGDPCSRCGRPHH
jgi:hypothetical protein